MIQLKLSDYPDEQNQALPVIVYKMKKISRQFGSDEESQVVQMIGSATNRAQ